MKIKRNSRGGFTLIELLIVIAIIGILAGVILVSTGSARNKAKDAAIISAANSLMKAAQIDSIATGVYTAWHGSSWGDGAPNPPTRCDNTFNSVPAALRSNVVTACKSILNNEVAGGANTNDAYIWANSWSWNGATYANPYSRYSIMVWLPGAQKYYCIGSNGRSSSATNGNANSFGSGCGGINSWNCPGCAGDPTTDGS